MTERRWHNDLMRLLAPLWSRATYRGWIWVILGGALMMPFMMVGAVGYNWWRPYSGFSGVLEPGVFLAVLPLVAAVSLLLPDREIERTAARRLLGARFESPVEDDSWNSRWRTGCWFTLHAAVGGVLSGVTLALVPFVAYLLIAGVDGSEPLQAMPERLPPRWGLLLGPLFLALLVWLVAAASAGMRRLAPLLLGQGAADRLAGARAEAARLAARNRIARELHDSVGHALSVVVVQSDAAARLIEADPAFAARAMAAVGETARGALAELDTVIGALREDGGARRAPQHDLGDLETLADECGVEVELRVSGDLAALGRLASREAYRIVQEALTNVLRHADRPEAVVEVAVGEGRVRIAVDSPSARPPRPGRHGRGLIGMGERAAVVGGAVRAGREGGRWLVRADIPLEETTERADDGHAAAHSADR
ncbi:sensor histidine kinase [Glycomyces arizonensis]|uniref:sensor histidine kinase n=1 Tax=Glycomyces arizonensis TaxID=256035 RepID=UPI000407620D|nr:histidine kinase [Glycomyces arizonensis]